ncbi:DUF443 family protein, partial [Staphylococcus aureus]|uniref:DUF443 family protein n=1 Tax=Staphylococcus aureus TaxID=1280 RepID=UPI001EF0063F
IINKNPKCRIIKYNDEYLMIDIISTWISLFFPFINWFITKRYVKISREEFENLNIVKPAKKNVFWPVAGISTLFAVTLRKYTHLLDTQLDRKLVIAICVSYTLPPAHENDQHLECGHLLEKPPIPPTQTDNTASRPE